MDYLFRAPLSPQASILPLEQEPSLLKEVEFCGLPNYTKQTLSIQA